MVERVARAIAKQHGFEDWVAFDMYRGLAIAAIETMRNPDRKMLDAACKAMSPGRRPTEARVSVRAKHGIRYRAMVDAALSTTHNPEEK